jgi:energy-coupling factor transporter ATP-binding protein EcfA2
MIIKIPLVDSDILEFDLSNARALVLLGTNGVGKSRLGAYLEKTIQESYRIPTLTNNSISDNIPNMTFNEAKNQTFYGHKSYNVSNKLIRYSGDKQTSLLISNYDSLLNTLIAKNNLESLRILKKARESFNSGSNHEDDLFEKDILQRINATMKKILPYFEAEIKDGNFYMHKNGKVIRFPQMSDGERKAFYYVTSVFLSEQDFIIIDEPEQHMNRDLLSRLWDSLFEEFENKKFCFITHDLDFAASLTMSELIWIRSYDNNRWDCKKINKENGIPEQLRFNVVGNREKILFVEGEKNTPEFFIYKSIYKDFKVIPCGDCNSVVRNTIAINDQTGLHNTTAIGIIDRDFRNVAEIESLKEKSIYVLRESEFECAVANKVIIEAYCTHMGIDFKDVIVGVEQTVFDLAAQIINQQTILKLAYEVKKLTENPDKNKLDDVLNNAISLLPQMKEDIKNFFECFVSNRDYDGIITNFNNKGIGKIISTKLGIVNYINTISQLLNSGSEVIQNAVKAVFRDNVIK